ncbi:luciferin 4-monooxygenase-like [Leguminivora glycinivorella]|uniref:luciferin 4-monooxygenase-like n=1 Tax=Leguminivora glycinivorella TaxID=1035111 RepID=UPI00200E99DC|nr:luciferin 4-monooxygenase-like [Leguminivora glycinivorella]XP_047999159.1 luciferin 4-monooxygenase-like [Leguminivora glycinivorella]
MHPSRRVNDSVHWFMNGLASRVVAESGIPSDVHHLGKIVLRSLKDDPDFVLQIDGATGESETNGSVLERTVRCAIALKSRGLQRGDVITLMAPNHIDLAIPFYAALYLGVIVSPIDRTSSVDELQRTFEVTRPKVVFCQNNRAQDVQLALNGIGSDAFIITFDKGDQLSFPEFLEKYGGESPIDEFIPTDFDPEDTIALLLPTSGTTGLPKSAAATHKNLAITAPYDWIRHTKFPSPTRMVFVISPLQWLTAIAMFLASPIMRITRLQSSQTLTQKHTYQLINKYKPTFKIVSPTFLTTLLTPEGYEECDFSCFETIMIGGSAVTADLIQEIKRKAPRAEVLKGYGMSEVTSLVFINEGLNPGSATVGKPMGCLQYRLIDVENQEDIYQPYKNGELWVKGPGIIKEYYRNPEATAEAFAENGWFKTGDMFYRDDNYNFFYVERIKLLLKYMNHQISPVELESTIRRHPGVLDVAVIGIPDKRGDLPVACVVRRPRHYVSAEEIEQLVKDTLAETKQLRGGVIFLDAIPQTASTKIHRRKLKEIAIQMLTN